jgi:aspartokinase/homoserine dehydrogenase 1
MTTSTWEVWKFGGVSLADGRAMREAINRIRKHRGPLAVVASALAGVTDLLLTGADAALGGGRDESAKAAATLKRKHDEAAGHLLKGRRLSKLLAIVDESVREYEAICGAIAVLGHLTPRVRDAVVARGERLSAQILASALEAEGGVVAYIDAAAIVRTDDRHGSATPLVDATGRRLRAFLRDAPSTPDRLVIPGFIGAAPDGSVTTMGRGGSDLTATLVARCLRARRVVLWKDVPGILTADPRMVPDARVIPELHRREAAEVAYFGAKVLHPRALIPLTGTAIPVEVRSFINPDVRGTDVTARRSMKGYPVKALALLADQAVITVAGKGMAGVHGIAARAFAAVDAEALSVSTIFQASSESSIGFTLPAADAERAVAQLRRAFSVEIAQGLIDGVSARSPVAVIAVVGEGMVGTPGISARVFSALAAGGVNVVAIAQGSSERNISFVVASADARTAMQRVHDTFQLSKIGGGRAQAAASTDVVLLGFGRVGRALADQIVARSRKGSIRIVGLLDRSGFVFDADGLSRSRLLQLAKAKDQGALLAALGGTPATAADALAFMGGHAVSRPVVVDVTSDHTTAMLVTAITQGFDVVLANKKPIADSWEAYEHLMQTAASCRRTIKFEATVGAGLPIIDTFHKLDDTGDRVRRIEGSVSGTLMFVLSEVSAGRAFSEAVREAVARGYAEPDPREDLSGRDAMRKALILARLLGYRGGPPAAEDLMPPAFRSLPVATFMERLPELDESFRIRMATEAARGRTLRYVVSATPRRVTCGLVAVPLSSPFGAASGTRNTVIFHSDRYRHEPLVISGPGAGADVTAAGLLNDLATLVNANGPAR